MRIYPSVAGLCGLVYFIQGALGLAGIALPLYLRAQGFSISKIAFIGAVSSAPWFLKIFYGAVSDSIPIWGLRRKPYLILWSGLSVIGWFLLAFLPPREYLLILSMGIANLGLAATDVVTDGLVVEQSYRRAAPVYQGIAWGARSVGAVISGLTGGILAARYSASAIFCLTGILPVISMCAAILIHEEKVDKSKIGGAGIVSPIIMSFKHILSGDLRWFSLLLLIVSSSGAIGTPLFFYMKETLRFDEIFLGFLSSAGWMSAIAGCLIFLKVSRHFRLKDTLYWAVVIAFIDLVLVCLIHSRPSALLVTLVSGVLSYMTLLPLMSSAAALTHGTGVEGSLFAVLTSIYNVGLAASGFAGGVIYEWVGLRSLVMIVACLALVGLLLIRKLKAL